MSIILLQLIWPELLNAQIPFRLYFTDNFSLMCLFLVPINSLLFKIKDGKSYQHECVWIRRASFPI